MVEPVVVNPPSADTTKHEQIVSENTDVDIDILIHCMANNYVKVRFLNGAYYAIKQSTSSGSTWSAIVKSTDGTTWTQVMSMAGDLRGLAYGNNVYVAVGLHIRTQGTDYLVYAWSSDGTNWSNSGATTGNGDLYDVKYVSNQFIAVGSKGDWPVKATSTNGSTWTFTEFSTIGSLFKNKVLYSIANDGSNWVAVGICCIQNGVGAVIVTDWPVLYGIAYGNSTYVAVGVGGAIYKSDSGRGGEWTAETSGVTRTLADIVRASNQFVAVGNAGTILTSLSGTTWASRTSGTTQNLRGVCAK